MWPRIPTYLALWSLPVLVICTLRYLVESVAAQREAASFPQIDVGRYCCWGLWIALGSKVSFPYSIRYQASVDSFWSNQNIAISPTCIMTPTSTADVSKAVNILRLLSKTGERWNIGCMFAIRSGGHTPWAGAATVENGITFDLSGLNQFNVSSDQTTTSIGPGNRWIDVYLKLDALGLAIPGGRVASVGIGGLVTGGGISFFSPRAGFVADNVVNFEVVLASGDIVDANASSNPSLWEGLKGGSNNLGIVTRVDIKTFAQDKLWGGNVVYSIDTLSEQLSAFVSYTDQKSYDTYGALINSYAWTAKRGWIIANSYVYTKAVTHPESFRNFTSIQPEVYSTMRISNLSDFTIELEGRNPYGRNQLFFTSTYSNDLDTLTQVFEQANASLQAVKYVANLTWALSLQPIPTVITAFSDITGGNVLGLHPSDGNLALVLLTASFDKTADISAVTSAVSDMFLKNDVYAANLGTLKSYKYLNYAYKTQLPIVGYGAENVAKLRAASRKFDPQQVFQKWVPGGFKLPA